MLVKVSKNSNPGDFLVIYSLIKLILDSQLVLQMKPKKFLLSLRIRSKVANLVMDYEECMTKALKITGEKKKF